MVLRLPIDCHLPYCATLMKQGASTFAMSWQGQVNTFGTDTDVYELQSLGGGEPNRAPLTGIKALMLAVLDNGITSYLSAVPRIRAEAECWVDNRSQVSPFSFQVVCETLGLEPDAVRVELHRLRNRDRISRTGLGRPRPNVRRTGRLLAREAG